MPRRPATLFHRLRLHKGAWMLLALAVFLKVASASACLLDGPRMVVANAGQIGVEQVAQVAASPASAGSDDLCMLGESGECHCACAHASTFPALALTVNATPVTRVMDSHPAATLRGGIVALHLRPPIA